MSKKSRNPESRAADVDRFALQLVAHVREHTDDPRAGAAMLIAAAIRITMVNDPEVTEKLITLMGEVIEPGLHKTAPPTERTN